MLVSLQRLSNILRDEKHLTRALEESLSLLPYHDTLALLDRFLDGHLDVKRVILEFVGPTTRVMSASLAKRASMIGKIITENIEDKHHMIAINQRIVENCLKGESSLTLEENEICVNTRIEKALISLGYSVSTRTSNSGKTRYGVTITWY